MCNWSIQPGSLTLNADSGACRISLALKDPTINSPPPMPSVPSEPEKYSIDEMLERLKEKTSETPTGVEGEWVTRADGTQAVRVRKHKRRTEQPQREQARRSRRIRIIQVSVVLVGVLLAGLVTVGAYVYANTVPYRQSITRAIAQCVGAEVEFKGFRVSPASANVESVGLAYPEGNMVKSILLHGVSAKISLFSLLQTSLCGEEVFGRDGTLVLQAPLADRPVFATADESAHIPVQFDRINVAKFNILAGDPARPALKINATEASLRFNQAGNDMALHLYRGNLQLATWPAFEIDRAVMGFNGAEIVLSGLRLVDSQPKRGILELAGTIRPFATDTPSILAVKLQNFNLGMLLGQEFSDLINAKIDSRVVSSADANYLSFLPGSGASVDLDVAFKSTLASPVNIKGFPFLFSLVRALNDTWYENPIFVEEVTGVIHCKNSKVELHELKLESKSRLAIKGNMVTGADKSLSGTLEIGIPASVVELSQNPQIDSMLGPLRDGFRWLTLELSGTLAHPDDDFARLYAAAKEHPAAESDPPAHAKSSTMDPEPAAEAITRPEGP